MRGNLFVKIFLWFWLALVLVGAALVLSSVWITSRGLEEGWRRRMGGALRLYSRTLEERIQQEGPKAAPEVAARLEREEHVKLYVLDAGGRDLARPGSRPPAAVAEVAGRALERRHRAFRRWRGRPLIAHFLRRLDGPPLVAVFVLPHHPGLNRLVEPRALALRLLLVLGLGTVLCYGLARYLTAPVARLRAATKELADGNLAVRVGPDLGGRRDEIAALGRDFDRMAGRLEEMVVSQRRLLRDVSHELRSPLARLNVALELARQRSASAADGPLDRIEGEAERLNELIGRLLDLTRLESGAAASREEVDLRVLVDEVVADAAFEAQARRCDVRVDGESDVKIRGVPSLLESAIENVVRNAVAYTAEGTRVDVTLIHRGDEAVITVRDHGAGVPEDALGHLFEPFFRVDPSRERSSGGVGLGLAITRRAVEVHGGRVAARNAADGGLVVEITLPIQC